MSTLASCRQQKQICRVKWLVQRFGDGGGFAFDRLRSALRTQHLPAAGARGARLEHILCLGFIWNQFDSLALRAVRDGNESVVGSSERSGGSDQERTPEPNPCWCRCLLSSVLQLMAPCKHTMLTATNQSPTPKTEEEVFPSNTFPREEEKEGKKQMLSTSFEKMVSTNRENYWNGQNSNSVLNVFNLGVENATRLVLEVPHRTASHHTAEHHPFADRTEQEARRCTELYCVTATEPRADQHTEPYGKHREHQAQHLHHLAWEEEKSLRIQHKDQGHHGCVSIISPVPSPPQLWPCRAAHTAVHPPELLGQTCRWDGLHFGAAPVPLRRCGLHEAAPPPRSAAAAAGGEASKTIFNLKIRNWSRLRARRLIETKFKFLSSPFKHRGPS